MFLQYLWGIETLPRQNYLRPTTGFYSTYEELKHVREGKTLPNTSSFYSTYEELKLALPLNWTGDLKVFTVPMRNWNLRLN